MSGNCRGGASTRTKLERGHQTALTVMDSFSFPPLICDSCDHAKVNRKSIRKESTTRLATFFLATRCTPDRPQFVVVGMCDVTHLLTTHTRFIWQHEAL